ncbi:MAG TPA: hypothetical protein VHO72_12210 [Bacteroidales bacterium]|nr:hypothetical protein [Bacteroidales bacterium]
MYRRLFKFVVTTLTILTANLVTTYISEYLISYKSHLRPITFSLVAMGIICIIFYPLFIKLEEWINGISSKIAKGGKSLGGKYLGLIIVYFSCLAILTYLYAKLWYKIDLLKILFSGKISYYL